MNVAFYRHRLHAHAALTFIKLVSLGMGCVLLFILCFSDQQRRLNGTTRHDTTRHDTGLVASAGQGGREMWSGMPLAGSSLETSASSTPLFPVEAKSVLIEARSASRTSMRTRSAAVRSWRVFHWSERSAGRRARDRRRLPAAPETPPEPRRSRPAIPARGPGRGASEGTRSLRHLRESPPCACRW